METYGKILLIAMPAFLLLVLAEKFYAWRKGKDNIHTLDTVSSLLSGVTNVTKDVLGLSIVVYSYGWLVEHLAVVHIEATFLVYLIAFLALDFAGYWVHRIQHQYNVFWNSHVVHHSSEEFNLGCALRQSISSIFKIFAVFLLPAALFGVPEKVIAVVAPLHLFAQFWYHTIHIDRMGWLEKIIVTPSHHRVHHAINPEYMDKNYGQIFIFWDKLFGTYQEEKPEWPPVYGISRPASTWNPVKINFQHLWLLIKDAWRTNSLADKLKIWWMPTGWRPADVMDKFPVQKIENVYQFQKYTSPITSLAKVWYWVQLASLLLLLSYLFGNIATIGKPGIFYYGFFIFLFVYAFAELMDVSPYAWVWEGIKFSFGMGIILCTKDWFGANQIHSSLKFLVVAYLMVSFVATFVLSKQLSQLQHSEEALPADISAA